MAETGEMFGCLEYFLPGSGGQQHVSVADTQLLSSLN